jgi:REP element-mobilizing transposase RayT
VAQFVTFRLGDAVPLERLEAWQNELRMLPEPARKMELIDRIERHLDAGTGSAVLRDPGAAAIVERVIRHHDGMQYELHAWVIMPNHVHVLFTPRGDFALSEIIQAWKSVSARRANQLLGRTGKLWQEDYFDRYMRGARHCEQTVGYIEWNPVEAGLCEAPEEWVFGSARHGAGATSADEGVRAPERRDNLDTSP